MAIQVLIYGSKGPAKDLPATTARYTFQTPHELVERVGSFKFEWKWIHAFQAGFVIMDMSKEDFMKRYVNIWSDKE